MPKFIDSEKVIHSCTNKSCENCKLNDKVVCHFNSNQLYRFLSVALIVALVGAYGVYRFSLWALIVQIGLYLLYFGFVEIRVMCSHCPHYGEPKTKSLQCWANYGSPKIWKYSPGPMNKIEKAVFLLGMAIIAFYPTTIILINGGYVLAIVYTILVIIGYALLETKLCVKCFNFACPFNRVKKAVRDEFFELNPSVKEAWKK